MSEVVCMTDLRFRPCVQRTSDSRSVLNSPALRVNLVRTRVHGGRDLGIPADCCQGHRALGCTDLHL